MLAGLVRAFVICVILLLPFAAQSESKLILTDKQSEYSLGTHISLFEDTSGKLSINDIVLPQYNDQYRTFNEESPSLSFSGSTFWIRVKVVNTSAETNWLLVQHFAFTHFLNLYTYNKTDKSYTVQKSGSNTVIENRYPHRLIIFPQTFDENQEKTLYLELKSDSAINLKLKLWNEHYFFKKDHVDTFWNGVFYGSIIIAFCINLLLFYFFRRPYYLYLVGFIFFTFTTFIFYDGYGQMFFAEKYIQYTHLIGSISISLSMILLLSFGQSLFKIHTGDQKYKRAHNVLITILTITLIMHFITSYHIAILSRIPFIFLTLIYLMYAGLSNWKRQNNPGRFIVFGISSFFIGLFFVGLNQKQ